MSDQIKAEYFESQIREKLGRILGEQRKIFESRKGEISGNSERGRILSEALAKVSVGISREGEGVVARMNYPVDIRFFDMKRILNWKIYNRKLWGETYGDLLQDIRHEFEDWLRKYYPEQLRKYGYKE